MSHLHRQLAANLAVAAQQAEKGAETHPGCTPTVVLLAAAEVAQASRVLRARNASSKAKSRRKAKR